MDYTIRNTKETLADSLFQKANELATNKERTKGGSITENEVSMLLEESKKNDGIISEEEIRYIAGLTSEANVQQLSKTHFRPVAGELKFQDVSSPRLNSIRNEAQNHSDKMSSVERAVRNDATILPFFNALNNQELIQDQREELMTHYLGQYEDNHFLRTVLSGEVFSSGSLEFISTEAPNQLQNVLKHEMLHAADFALSRDPQVGEKWKTYLNNLYQAAQREGKIALDESNPHEYFAHQTTRSFTLGKIPLALTQ